MKRINLFMEPKVHSRIKAISALKGSTMNDYIEEAIANLLKKDKTLFEKLK
jgi:hypothetical protein